MKNAIRYNHKSIKHFLLSYSIIIILPLIVGIVSYLQAAQIIKHDIKNSCISYLSQTMEITDNILGEIDKITNQISQNPQVIKLRNLDPSDVGAFFYQLYDAHSYISLYSQFDRSNTDYLVYFAKSDRILTPRGAFTYKEYYECFGYTDISADTFKSTYLNCANYGKVIPSMKARRSNLMIGANEVYYDDVITYFKSMPVFASGSKNGTVIAQVKTQTILNNFSRIDLSNDGCAYVLNANGNLITGIPTSSGQFPDIEIAFDGSSGFYEGFINGKRVYITYTVSNYNGWKYVSIIPSKHVMARADYIRNFILNFTGISLLIGFILLYILTQLNLKPIFELKKSLSDYDVNDGDSDLLDSLRISVTSLISANKTILGDMERQRGSLQKAILNQLMEGQICTPELILQCKEAGIDLAHPAFLCAFMSVDKLNSDVSNVLNGLIICQNGIYGYYSGESMGIIRMIICIDTNNEAMQNNQIYNSVAWLKSTLSTTAVIGKIALGEICHSVSDINKSYMEAEHTFQCFPKDSKLYIMRYHELHESRANYYYPIEVEQRILSVVSHGYTDEFNTLFESILSGNQRLTPSLQKLFKNEIEGTLYKLSPEQYEEWMYKLSKSEDYKSYLLAIRDLLLEYCAAQKLAKSTQTEKFWDRVLVYLEKNYNDSELSLSKISNDFNRSESYISNLFKEHADEYFASYLENIRLDAACNLLKDGRFNISQISQMTGYNSPQSFRRAFKRVKGINPTDYTENL